MATENGGTKPVTTLRPVSVLDVSEILQSRFVLITGGIARDGCPLVTFPDVEVDAQSISDEDYKKIMAFVATIPTLSDADIGYVVVIDKRRDKWNSVKTLLLKLSALFPGYVREVLVLRPGGFFQRTFKEVSSKWLHDNFQFEVILLQSLEELHRKVDPAHLTTDLGGTFMFDAKEWVQHRFAIESYGNHCMELADRLVELTKSLDELEMPNDAAATEELIAAHSRLKEETVDEIMEARNQGDMLLSCFRRKCRSGDPAGGRSYMEVAASMLGHDRLVHLASTERLMVQLGEANACFNQFWERHQRRLDSCLRLRKFEEDFKEMQYRLEQVVQAATALPRCASSVAEFEVLMADLKAVEADSEGHVVRAQRLRSDGASLASESAAVAVAAGRGDDVSDSVLPKCAELERMCSLYRTAVAERRESIARSGDLHRKVEQLKKWCSDGLDLLADGLDARLSGLDALQTSLLDLEVFLRSGNAFNFKDPSEFRKVYDDIMCPATRESVQDVLLRASDVQDLCSRRRAALRDAVAASTAAALTATGQLPAVRDSPLMTKKRLSISAAIGGTEFRTRDALPLSPSKQPVKAAETGAGTRMTLERTSSAGVGALGGHRQIPPDNRPYARKRSFSLKEGLKGIFLRKRHDGEDNDEPEPLPSLTGSDDGSESGELSTRDSSQKAAAAAMMSSVMGELVETEKVYVIELQEIVQGYVGAVNDAALSHLLPSQLLPTGGGYSVLFGNIEKVLAFHADIFLEELLKCRNTPAQVSRCFLTRVQDFKLYLDYCQNKPNSDRLLEEIGDNNAFLKECQHRLGHLLPLGSYLLKPVQRITKYQLLLREMLHYTEESESESEDTIADLRKALEGMLDLLKHANDLMHHLSITGYKTCTPTEMDRGKLLMQGPLTVSVSRRKDRMPTFRLRTMSRHAFLYEKTLLFCKPKEEASAQMIRSGSFRDHYRYKSSVLMSAVESVSEDPREPRRLELRLRGGGSAIYSLQTANVSVRDEWLRELRRALLLLVDDASITLTSPEPSEAARDPEVSGSTAQRLNQRRTVPCTESKQSAAPGGTNGVDTDEGWSSGDDTHSDGDLTADMPRGSNGSESRYPCLMTYSLAAREALAPNSDYGDGDELLLGDGDVVECLTSSASSSATRVGELWICARIPGTEVKGWLPRSCLLPYAGPKPIAQEESGCSISSGSSCHD